MTLQEWNAWIVLNPPYTPKQLESGSWYVHWGVGGFNCDKQETAYGEVRRRLMFEESVTDAEMIAEIAAQVAAYCPQIEEAA